MKIDLKKTLKEHYSIRKNTFATLKYTKGNYVTVDGIGAPGSKDFGKAIEMIYKTSYKTKFAYRSETGVDYGVPPLEALWWADDFTAFKKNRREEWKWTVMLRIPDFVEKDFVMAIRNKLGFKDLKFKSIDLKKTVRTLHMGSYDNEGETVEALHNYAHKNGFELCGKHLEIYLNDPRRTKPENLKTIIVQQVK